MSANWCLIESDPGVLSELVSSIGVEGVQVEELYDLSVEGLRRIAPVHGLLFLFKYGKRKDIANVIQHDIPELYFAKQVINNACATQALLNVLMNSPTVTLGPELSSFKEFTAGLPPEFKGEAIGMSETIRAVHNSFARQETFSIESRVATDDDDVFHFVGYVPFKGRIYELDGLNDGPIDHGSAGDDWLDKIGNIVQSRIDSFGGSEIRFNLCAVVADREVELQKQIDAYKASVTNAVADETSVSLFTEEIARLQELVAAEVTKKRRYAEENTRRKHNYVPLILETLRQMANHGMLASDSPHMKQARKKAFERAERQKK